MRIYHLMDCDNLQQRYSGYCNPGPHIVNNPQGFWTLLKWITFQGKILAGRYRRTECNHQESSSMTVCNRFLLDVYSPINACERWRFCHCHFSGSMLICGYLWNGLMTLYCLSGCRSGSCYDWADRFMILVTLIQTSMTRLIRDTLW